MNNVLRRAEEWLDSALEQSHWIAESLIVAALIGLVVGVFFILHFSL